MRAGAMRRIKLHARRPIQPVTIRQLLARSRAVSDSDHVRHAEWLREQLPVRLAHRLSDFMQLPYVVLLNARFHEVFRLNFQAFETLASAEPVHDAASSAEFAEVLHRLVRSTDDMVRILQEGYGELQALLGDSVELDSFIDRVFVTRIGNRLLAEHYVAVDEARSRGGGGGVAGVVRQDCRPAEVVGELSRSLGDRFRERYGARPLVVVEGQTDTEFSFVPEHLDFMLQEVLKNAMRATVETHIDSSWKLPPVSVEIMKGSFDVTLKISDAGGGMRRDTLERIWKYGYTSTQDPAAQAVLNQGGDFASLCGQDVVSMREIAGYGFGLPLSRVYAQYFGGDIHVQSMHGYGTDVYLNLNHLGDTHDSDAAHHAGLVGDSLSTSSRLAAR